MHILSCLDFVSLWNKKVFLATCNNNFKTFHIFLNKYVEIIFNVYFQQILKKDAGKHFFTLSRNFFNNDIYN